MQEKKAVLVLELHRLCRRPPPELGNASVQGARAWLSRFKAARRLKADPRASVRALAKAVEAMRAPVPGPGFRQP